MNILDIILLIPIIWFGFKGFKNGLIKEIVSFLAIIIGFFGAMKLSCYLEQYVSTYTSATAEYIPIIAFIICFIAILIGVYLLSGILNKFVNVIKLEWLNKLGGMLFGVLKTMIILSAIFFIFNRLNANNRYIKTDFLQKSLLYNPIKKIFPTLYPFIPNIESISNKIDVINVETKK